MKWKQQQTSLGNQGTSHDALTSSSSLVYSHVFSWMQDSNSTSFLVSFCLSFRFPWVVVGSPTVTVGGLPAFKLVMLSTQPLLKSMDNHPSRFWKKASKGNCLQVHHLQMIWSQGWWAKMIELKVEYMWMWDKNRKKKMYRGHLMLCLANFWQRAPHYGNALSVHASGWVNHKIIRDQRACPH